MGGASQTYTNEISVGDVTRVAVSNLTAGSTYFFAAKAVNGEGLESALSVETSYTVPVYAWQDSIVLGQSEDLVHWTNIFSLPCTNSRAFYRLGFQSTKIQKN